MNHKILAELSGLVDLFPGQYIGVDDNRKIVSGALAGTDFDLAVLDEDFADTAIDGDKRLRARLSLPPLALLGGQRLALDVDLHLVRKTDWYLWRGAEALGATLPALPAVQGLTLHEGAATLVLGLDPWILTVENPDATPIASVALPGLPGIAFALQRLVVDASGVQQCKAVLVPGQIDLGGLRMQIADGALVLRGSRFEAQLQARFDMPYFSGASVDVQLAVSGDLANASWSVTAQTRIANNIPWRDPSGMLGFDQMSVDFSVSQAGAGVDASLRIGGRVTFLPCALAADADAWFGRLFSGLAVSFDKVPMTGAALGLPKFAFSPPESLRLRAFEIFDMTVPKLAFDQFGVSLLDARLRFEAGGAVLGGSVGEIRISLAGGPAIDLRMGKPSIALEMAAPGGFKGQAELIQVDEANVQAVEGHGRISAPAFGAVEASFHIGRFRRAEGAPWIPALSVMAAQDDVNIALFPGVVLTRVELGAGINRRVAGVTGLSLREARARLQQGLPDVFLQESWEDTETDLCVVARLFAESSQTSGADALSMYVADMSLVMTSDFQFALFGKLWFYTSRADARSAPFQAAPSAVGLALFDGRQPSLRIVAMTRGDGRSSLGDRIPAGVLMAMQPPRAQLAFEAAPSGMALVLGPVEVGTTLGPLAVAGSSMFVLRSAGGRVYALSQSSLSASFSASTGELPVGPARLSGTVSAAFAASLALLGHFDSGRLTIYGLAHASCSVELALHVRIGFSIRISIPFGSIRISWHEHWDFSLSMHIDLDLEATLTSAGGIGIDGRARLSVDVLGISASLSLRIVIDAPLVEEGRAVHRRVLADVDNLLGASA